MTVPQYGLYMSGNGRKVVAAASTAEQLSTTSVPCRWVYMTALASCSGIVVAGVSTVVATASSRAGVALSGGQSVLIPVSDLNALYLDVTVAGEGISYAYFNHTTP